MKKILFVLYSYNIGGTAVSTRNLINLLNKEKYEPHVWVMNDQGPLKDLYKDCNLVKTNFFARALMLTSYKEIKGLCRIFAMLIRFARNRSLKLRKIIYHIAVKRSINPSEYDTIVACKEGNETDFVSYIRHNNKVAWMRCDYIKHFREYQIRNNKQKYDTFSRIVCVSETTMKNFLEIYPEFIQKTIFIHNPQDEELIRELATKDDKDNRFKTDKITILSIGRIHPVKRFSMIPKIAKRLLEKGFDFCWYIIGEGDSVELKKIKQEIVKNNVEDFVVLLGVKNNPHFYINKADVLVTISESEACPRVVNEAKILHTPVVSTDFSTIYEFIDNNKNGIIAPIEKIDDAIIKLFQDNKLYEQIRKENENFKFDNTVIMKKIETVL